MGSIIGIACCDRNLGIGKNNDILFDIKLDKLFFKDVTSSNTVVVGGNTYRSMRSKPLFGRQNLLLSSTVINPGYSCLEVYRDPKDIIEVAHEHAKHGNVYIIGGAKIYMHFVDHYDYLLITYIDADRAANAYMPRAVLQGFNPISYLYDDIMFDRKSNTNVFGRITLFGNGKSPDNSLLLALQQAVKKNL